MTALAALSVAGLARADYELWARCPLSLIMYPFLHPTDCIVQAGPRWRR